MWKPIERMSRATPEQLAYYFESDNTYESMILDGICCVVYGVDDAGIVAYPEPAYFDENGELFSILDGADLRTEQYNLFMPI